MKKTLFLIAGLLLAFSFSYAQTEKGILTLGLNLGLAYHMDYYSVINSVDNATTCQFS